MLRFMARALVVLLVLAVALGTWAYVELNQPYGEFERPIAFEYLPGASGRETADALQKLGVFRSRWHFLVARALHPKKVLLAGEYNFSVAESPWNVISRLAAGDVLLRQLTIPEGLTRFETAKLVAAAGYAGEAEFLKLTADGSLVRDLAPEAKSLEGFLFPETYSLSKTTSAEQIVQAMLANFRRAYAAAIDGADHDLDAIEAITLASLIEKETGVRTERPLVSAVFHNRLERGMLLQCDPTIIYGLIVEDRYRGNIYASDLKDPHPYNTYVHTGLPPGPIANPGEASLRAALAPAESDYIFFVANPGGGGSHTFSVSLSDHNRAVARFRAGGD
jgi:UPF0755 protein